MRLIADESVDQPVIDRLRSDGLDVAAVAEMAPGLADDAVLEAARSRDAVLLTADKDFGELVHRQGRANTGIVLLRLAGMAPSEKAAAVARVIQEHGSELKGAFAVISPGLVRVRRSNRLEP